MNIEQYRAKKLHYRRGIPGIVWCHVTGTNTWIRCKVFSKAQLIRLRD